MRKKQPRQQRQQFQKTDDTVDWKPKTDIGKKVKSGEIKNLYEIIDSGKRILEPQIVDVLEPELKTELLLIGQAKGKFGGGQRRIFRQTQKKTREGNKPKFSTCAVVGNEDGLVGIGYGKAKETVPAREKAFRKAKLNIIKVPRGCGSWQCGCGTPHTIPFNVEGKVGSVIVKLMPAPKGTGLVCEKELQKVLRFAGITDVWSKTEGRSRTKLNLLMACFKALKKLSQVKVPQKAALTIGMIEGSSKLAGEQNE
ncbi:30S ribosomal protein S5 [Candidatus Woesearchaeota archaeon]|nr:30S ribosomal protein S5 [Candidatus Woesearchaeota archaeon]